MVEERLLLALAILVDLVLLTSQDRLSTATIVAGQTKVVGLASQTQVTLPALAWQQFWCLSWAMPVRFWRRSTRREGRRLAPSELVR